MRYPDIGPDWAVSTIRNNVNYVNSGLGLTVATNWPTANKAYYCRVWIPYPVILKNLWFINGTASSGNVDTGIYDGKTLAKLASTGSIARTGTTVIQITAISPLYLPAGEYLFGHASDTTTNSRSAYLAIGTVNYPLTGISQETSAFPLPATATPAAISGTGVGIVAGGFTSLYGG